MTTVSPSMGRNPQARQVATACHPAKRHCHVRDWTATRSLKGAAGGAVCDALAEVAPFERNQSLVDGHKRLALGLDPRLLQRSMSETDLLGRRSRDPHAGGGAGECDVRELAIWIRAHHR
jgi:hypothetical protein